jgi:hypothetical protein
MNAKHVDQPQRRRFLRHLVAVGGATALLAATGLSKAPVVTPVAAKQSGAASGGYRLTPHINDYYRTLRF